MELNEPSRFWSAVGRILSLLTVIGTVVGIWRNVFPARHAVVGPNGEATSASLAGIIDYGAFDLPPDVKDQLERLRNLNGVDTAERYLQSRSTEITTSVISAISSSVDSLINNLSDAEHRRFGWLEQGIKTNTEGSEQLRSRLATSLARPLSEYANSGWAKENRYGTPSYESYVVIDVENRGNRQASGVELQLPYHGVSIVEEPGEKAAVNSFDRKLILGNILPKAAKKVRIWTTSAVGNYSWEPDRWHLIYADGVGKVIWPVRTK